MKLRICHDYDFILVLFNFLGFFLFVCFFAALDNNIATDTKECVVIIKSAKIVFFYV